MVNNPKSALEIVVELLRHSSEDLKNGNAPRDRARRISGPGARRQWNYGHLRSTRRVGQAGRSPDAAKRYRLIQ